MGLDSFETDGPRTFTDKSKSGTRQSRLVRTSEPFYASEFEEKYGMSLYEAENDSEFFAEQVREGRDLEELTVDFHCLPRTIVQRIIDAVDDGELDLDEIPEEYECTYNGRNLRSYVKERIYSDPFDNKSPQPKEQEESGLNAFRS